MLALLYLLSFLDRSNIGNAKIQGMQVDLALTGPQYNLCATVFVSILSSQHLTTRLLIDALSSSHTALSKFHPIYF